MLYDPTLGFVDAGEATTTPRSTTGTIVAPKEPPRLVVWVRRGVRLGGSRVGGMGGDVGAPRLDCGR